MHGRKGNYRIRFARPVSGVVLASRAFFMPGRYPKIPARYCDTSSRTTDTIFYCIPRAELRRGDSPVRRIVRSGVFQVQAGRETVTEQKMHVFCCEIKSFVLPLGCDPPIGGAFVNAETWRFLHEQRSEYCPAGRDTPTSRFVVLHDCAKGRGHFRLLCSGFPSKYPA